MLSPSNSSHDQGAAELRYEVEGRLVGTDALADIAVVKIDLSKRDKDAPPLPVAKWGKADLLKVGDPVTPAVDAFSPLAKPIRVKVSAGFAAPYARALESALTAR